MDRRTSHSDAEGQGNLLGAFETSQPESYQLKGKKVTRVVNGHESVVISPHRTDKNPPRSTSAAELFDQGWLQTKEPLPSAPSTKRTITAVDLFAGCGGLSLGVREGCRALGYELVIPLANDVDRRALAVYEHNLKPQLSCVEPVEALFDGDLGAKPTAKERKLMETLGLQIGELDFLVGGPPCQGHSDLNNRTRRDDPKNSLYARMARAAEILRPRHVIIENVPGVRHDRSGITDVTRRALAEIREGKAKIYDHVHENLLQASVFGVAQTRRRYFMVATRAKSFSFDRVINNFRVSERSLEWAIQDLKGSLSKELYDSPSKPTTVNQQRMDWFFRNARNGEQYNLPNDERPDCHKGGGHSYVGVYGRMRWNTPAPTITGGFGCAGQGRFTHPLAHESHGRTLTPHEAARVQFFPDFFEFSPLWTEQLGGRTALHQMIGNAVPPKFSYVLAVTLLMTDQIP